MKPIPLVIDTNVIVSALRSQQGASHQFLKLLPDKIYKPNLSVPLFLEYETVLKRPGLITGLLKQDIHDVLDYLLSQADIHPIFFLWRPFLKDRKDDLVLEIAVESASQFIITFNIKDFIGVECFGIQAITPQEFLRTRGILP